MKNQKTRRSIFEVSVMTLRTLEPLTRQLRLSEQPPREGTAFWKRGHPRNLAVGC